VAVQFDCGWVVCCSWSGSRCSSGRQLVFPAGAGIECMHPLCMRSLHVRVNAHSPPPTLHAHLQLELALPLAASRCFTRPACRPHSTSSSSMPLARPSWHSCSRRWRSSSGSCRGGRAGWGASWRQSSASKRQRFWRAALAACRLAAVSRVAALEETGGLGKQARS
jgi:hypothetical protein